MFRHEGVDTSRTAFNDPEIAERYELAARYRYDKIAKLEKRDHLVFLPDIKVEVGGDLELPPFGATYAYAYMPKDYFSGIVPDEETILFTKFLLNMRDYSIRSKFAQAGIVTRPSIPTNRPYIDLPMYQSETEYAFPIELMNHNPVNTYVFPDDEFEYFRFFVRGGQLTGNSLAYVAQSIGLANVGLEGMNGHVLTLDQVRSGILSEEDVMSFSALHLPLTKVAVYPEGPRSVDVAELLALPFRERGKIDQLLGFNWQEFDPARFDYSHYIEITESDKLKMPKDVAGIIDFNHTNTVAGEGEIIHIESPAVDPGFGLLVDDGMPIRFERKKYGRSFDRGSIRMHCYRTNPSQSIA